jgi:hypothetical protein
VKADFGSLSLEHMRDAPADDSRAYLHSINGLGSKSVACIILLALGLPEFPVDTNVGRIMVRALSLLLRSGSSSPWLCVCEAKRLTGSVVASTGPSWMGASRE